MGRDTLIFMWRIGILAASSCMVAVLFTSYTVGRSIEEAVPRRGHVTPKLLQENSPCDDSLSCWKSFYERAAKENPLRALQDLKARYNERGYLLQNCHSLLHVIGREAGIRYGSIARAYAYGDTFCRSGYYHGVLEGLFEGEDPQRVLLELDSVCAQVPGKDEYSYDYFACVHGVGHGLMALYEHELFDALKGCKSLSGEWEQSACYGGVFMENVIADTDELPSLYLDPDNLLYPCDMVEEEERGQCFMMQSSYMLKKNGGSFVGAFEQCARADEKFRGTCLVSIGRDASGWGGAQIEATAYYCLQGRTYEERSYCFWGASNDFVAQYDSDVEAKQLCEKADPEFVDYCKKVVTDYFATF